MSNLAEDIGLTRIKGYVAVAVLVTAFVAGIQITLIAQAMGDASYPPSGQGWLVWTTLTVLAASAVLHIPFEKVRDALAGGELDQLAEDLKPNRHRQVLLAPASEAQLSGAPAARATNGGHHHSEPLVQHAPPSGHQASEGHSEPAPAEAPRLKARVHSPLAAGPVVKPGDEIPITVEAEPKELAQELDVTITVNGPDGERKSTARMEDTTLVHTERFDTIGAFDITITLDHPRADSSSKQIQGRVASYREEVARIFEDLKASGEKAGLDVGPQSTPREVCRALRSAGASSPDQLASLAVELETALFGDKEVERATYETVYTTVRRLNLPAKGVQG